MKSTNTNRIIDLIVPAVIAIIAIVIFFLVHPAQKFVFVPAMVIAFICYLRTSYQKMPKAESVLPIYLVALAIQFLHFTEEYVYGFHYRVTEIMSGMPPFKPNVFVTFNMVAYSLFILAALGIYKGDKFSMIIVWFFVFGGVIGNAIWHPLLSLKVGGYFPGLYTSFAYLIVGPILLKRLWNENVR
jgi:hypothetical protein